MRPQKPGDWSQVAGWSCGSAPTGRQSYGHCRPVPRWLLPESDNRILHELQGPNPYLRTQPSASASSRAVGEPGTGATVGKDETGPDRNERSRSFSMTPNRAILTAESRFFPRSPPRLRVLGKGQNWRRVAHQLASAYEKCRVHAAQKPLQERSVSLHLRTFAVFIGRVAPGITPWSSHRSGRAR